MSLRGWIDTCAKICEAPNVRLLIESLADFIQYHFEGKETVGEIDQLADVITSNTRYLLPALDIIAASHNIMAGLSNNLVRQVREKLPPDLWVYENDCTPLSWEHPNSGIYLAFISDTFPFYCGIQFDSRDFSDGFFGVILKEKSGSRRPFPDLRAAVTSRLGYSGESWPEWLFATKLEHLDFGFPTSPSSKSETWAALASPHLADKFIREVRKISDIFSTLDPALWTGAG